MSVSAKIRILNQPYDKVYISIFTFADEQFYIEHNEKLDIDKVYTIFHCNNGTQ